MKPSRHDVSNAQDQATTGSNRSTVRGIVSGILYSIHLGWSPFKFRSRYFPLKHRARWQLAQAHHTWLYAYCYNCGTMIAKLSRMGMLHMPY